MLPGRLGDGLFTHDVETGAKPWTHLSFHNDPNDFQFAIVADRTGGHRPGVFPSAVGKLNLLRPEFVLTVGDMIEGYHEDEALLLEEWEEFNAFVHDLEMPFFYLPGNHDNINPTMARVYRKLFGRSYYAFTYRDVLFISLDTQDTAPPGLGEEQIAWALRTIEAHPDARWTIVLMHQPLWVYDEGNIRTSRKVIGEGRDTGFSRIQQALADRPYTVFAGHFHQYAKYVREDRNHIILGSTGGSSRLRGTAFGEFDHAVWITLTDDGPVIANLLLEGILDQNVHTEDHLRIVSSVAFDDPGATDPAAPLALSLPVANPFNHMMEADIAWTDPGDGAWRITPGDAVVRVPPNGFERVTFTVAREGDDPYPALPKCIGRITAGSEFMIELELPLEAAFKSYLIANRPTATAGRVVAAPVIDGVLNDTAWEGTPQVNDFRHQDFTRPEVLTEAWLGYDDGHLYLAVRCHETNPGDLRTEATGRDGPVWLDDSIEFFVVPRPENGVYYQYAANAAGVLYDGRITDGGFAGTATVATGREDDAWTLELQVPWKDLGLDSLDPSSVMTMLLVRNRPQGPGTTQAPPLMEGNHTPERFGFLAFEVEETAERIRLQD